METTILHGGEWHPSLQDVFKILRITDPQPEDEEEITAMLRNAAHIADPKAIYGIAAITEKGEDYVVAENVRLKSALVRENLENVNRIIPFVATCGVELEEWSATFDDPLAAYWADGIKMLYLIDVRRKLEEVVKNNWFPSCDMSTMSPGSLAAWPLPEQRALFNLLGSVTEDIGVRLTSSYLMLPHKSVSGFFFSAETHFENCRLCPLLSCPGRRAPYEKTK